MASRRRLLPDPVQRECNRLAQALAQWNFAQHRRMLELDAVALLKAGRTQDEVIELLTAQAAKER